MGAKKITQEYKEVKPSETRRKKLRLKRGIRRTLGILLIGGMLWGGLSGGYHLVQNMFNSIGSLESEANTTLAGAGEARANGEAYEVIMDEETALMTLNQMTHQKIKATEKHGAVEMNTNNINEMIHIVEVSSYENRGAMLRILKKWKRGDFTYIVQDHNEILDLQDGNIGKAYDVMSAEEENQFIKETFGDEKKFSKYNEGEEF